MADHNTNSSIESRLEAFGREERDRLSEPDPRFLRAVRDAAPMRADTLLLRRITVLFAAAAAILLAVLVALQTRPAPVSPGTGDYSPLVHRHDPDRLGAPGNILTAGHGRGVDLDDMINSLDRAPSTPGPRDAPARAADAYCAGCIDDLTRI